MGICPIDQPALTGHNYVAYAMYTEINDIIEQEERDGASLEDIIPNVTIGKTKGVLLLFFKPHPLPDPETIEDEIRQLELKRDELMILLARPEARVDLEGAKYRIKEDGVLHPEAAVDWKWAFDLVITDESGEQDLNDLPLWVAEGIRAHLPSYCLITEMNPRLIKEEEE